MDPKDAAERAEENQMAAAHLPTLPQGCLLIRTLYARSLVVYSPIGAPRGNDRSELKSQQAQPVLVSTLNVLEQDCDVDAIKQKQKNVSKACNCISGDCSKGTTLAGAASSYPCRSKMALCVLHMLLVLLVVAAAVRL